MVRIQTDLPNTSLRHEDAPNSELPLGSSTERQPPTRHEAMQKARLAVHRRSACSGLKACPWLEQGALRNTSDARRHAAKLCYRFGPLTPSARSANLIAGDGTKNGFPAPNKEPTTNQNQPLDRKSPIQVRIRFLPPASLSDERRRRLARLAAGLRPFGPSQVGWRSTLSWREQ
jgi:hypothetical protein